MIFIVLVSGYLAFSVGYNKAFKLKNKIINSIEECEGMDISTINDSVEGISNAGNKQCAIAKINKYIKDIAYSGQKNWDGKQYLKGSGAKACNRNNGFCIQEEMADTNCVGSDCKYIYNVVTSVNVSMPVLDKLAPSVSLFRVSGVTSAIRKR